MNDNSQMILAKRNLNEEITPNNIEACDAFLMGEKRPNSPLLKYLKTGFIDTERLEEDVEVDASGVLKDENASEKDDEDMEVDSSESDSSEVKKNKKKKVTKEVVKDFEMSSSSEEEEED